MNTVIVVSLLAFGIGFIVFVINPYSNDKIVNDNSSKNQSMIGNWLDIHGIGMFSKEKDQGEPLYVATHNGLFKKEKDNLSSWRQVGYRNFDLKGFTINPTKGIMYSSGHPLTSGNLGFRISSDYGVTWQKVSDVTTTPDRIDFHTMTIGSNPEIIYGAADMGVTIYISLDEGNTWTTVNSPNSEKIITLTTNKTDSNIIYAATTNGLFSSIDRGKNWQRINNELINGDSHDTIVTGLEISSNGKTAYAFVTPGRGEDIHGYIIKSTDGAKTWTKTNGQIEEAEFIGRFGFGNDGEIYAIVNQNTAKYGMASSVYKSKDQGDTWILEGTNNNSLAGI